MGREEVEAESLEGVGPSRLSVSGVGWLSEAVEKSIPHFSTSDGRCTRPNGYFKKGCHWVPCFGATSSEIGAAVRSTTVT